MTDLLVIESVCKAYRRGERRLQVFDELSLTVRAREIVAVSGSRYEGKSTLLRIAAGIELPDAGSVSVEGRQLGTLASKDRERLLAGPIAWLSREGSGVDLRILDHLAMPLLIAGRTSRDAHSTAQLMLERFDVTDLARQRWSELSNWERILVSLIRSVMGRPRLLIIDDLFDGLGLSKTEQAGDLLRGLLEEFGFGVLLSVSDLDAAVVADHVYCFERGALRSLAGGHAGSGQVVAFPGRTRAKPERTARADR